jgi:hypothetical protein
MVLVAFGINFFDFFFLKKLLFNEKDDCQMYVISMAIGLEV